MTMVKKVENKLNILNKKDKETMLYYVRKIVEDLNKFELVISSMDLNPQQNFQFHQLINNNRTRARKVIWGLSGSHLDEEELGDEDKILLGTSPSK